MPHSTFLDEFEYEIGSCRYFLGLAQEGGLKSREEYHNAVDAYGDAAKVAEDFDTSFLRERIPGLSNETYRADRQVMFQTLAQFHEELYAFKEARDPKRDAPEAVTV